MHGDESGLLKIPIAKIRISTLLARAKAVIKKEEELYKYITSESWDLKIIKEKMAPMD